MELDSCSFVLTMLLLTPDISGATYLASVTNTGYIRSLGTLALSKIINYIGRLRGIELY